MADVLTTQTLVVGAVGGLATLVGKYVIDRFTESHKASVGIRAKREERYYEKQAAAIAGTYERLAKHTQLIIDLRILESDISPEGLSEWRIQRLKEGMAEVEAASRDFKQFFTANQIYLPPSLSPKIQAMTKHLWMTTMHHYVATFESRNKPPLSTKDLKRLKRFREAAETLLEELRDRFRMLLLQDEPTSWYSAIWTWLKAHTKAQASPPSPAPVAAPSE